VAVLLALLAAGVYGTADFCGGLAARRVAVATVVLVSQTIGCLLAVAAAVTWSADEAAAAPFGWGAAAGTATGVAVLLFYWGLAHGSMSQVAPVAAVCSASIPVVFSVVAGEVPGAVALVGIAAAIPAIALVSRERTDSDLDRRDRRPILAGVGAGVGFGAYFVLFDQAGTEAGMWPVVSARLASTVVAAVAFVAVVGIRRVEELREGFTPLVAATGAFDFAAIALYLAATGEGLLAVVAVVTSLYPASTVLLARVVLHERLQRDQFVGIALAVVAVVLIALG
jgi:drug/metabolite transporter (DMT)-like permease